MNSYLPVLPRSTRRLWDRLESPRRLGFRDSLRSSLTVFAAVLASSGDAEPPAPFSPTPLAGPTAAVGRD